MSVFSLLDLVLVQLHHVQAKVPLLCFRGVHPDKGTHRSSFRRKPTWEEMAIFVFPQLCLSPSLRADLMDIQLHPVKKHLFLKFRDSVSRDQVATKLNTGVDWPAFETKVHGWVMDKVIVVRVHGVSPESTKQEIEAVLLQYVKIGHLSHLTVQIFLCLNIKNENWKCNIKFIEIIILKKKTNLLDILCSIVSFSFKLKENF